jgi:peptidoglycan/xylan/chitin deacetylase (PgdA/CDA1 family)
MKNLLKKPKPNLAFILSILVLISFPNCNSNPTIGPLSAAVVTKPVAVNASLVSLAIPKASVILNRPQIPILCYHQIRNWSPSDSKRAKDYIVPVDNFREQIKSLADNGYHTILPDQLYNYLLSGSALPSKPIMITFDDTRMEQYTIGSEEMNKYGFKGVFFIMTVALGKPGYMTREEVKQLADEGDIIGSHTWDHSNVKNYDFPDWIKQVDKPSHELEKITGKPIKYFAYPFGLWDKKAVGELKQRGFTAAFQLSERRDQDDPLFTIRRMIVPGEWSVATLRRVMSQDF